MRTNTILFFGVCAVVATAVAAMPAIAGGKAHSADEAAAIAFGLSCSEITYEDGSCAGGVREQTGWSVTFHGEGFNGVGPYGYWDGCVDPDRPHRSASWCSKAIEDLELDELICSESTRVRPADWGTGEISESNWVTCYGPKPEILAVVKTAIEFAREVNDTAR